MISVNATLFVQLSLFLILLFILNRLMIQPLFKLEEERKAHVQGKRVELRSIQEEIKQIAAECDARLRRAEREAREAHRAMREEANEEAQGIIVSAQEQIVALRQKAHGEMLEELAKAREQLAELAEKLSYQVTEKTIGRPI
jgi:F-type H+-transporting ATPase subunit b